MAEVQKLVGSESPLEVGQKINEIIEIVTDDDNLKINNPYFFGQYIWSEFAPDNLSWLKSGGQWNSGTGYQSFYDWILANANANKAGFKLSTASYTDYDFVVNTSNKTFRLPIKVKGKMGDAVVGNGMTLGLTDGTENFGLVSLGQQWSASYQKSKYGSNLGTSISTSEAYTSNKTVGITSDPKKSSLTLDTTGLSLYFYVGETTKDAALINAGQIATTIANKVEVVEAYVNGTSWYRVYSADQTGKRWCEQGGYAGTGNVSISFLKPFKDTTYSLLTGYCSTGASTTNTYINISSISTSGFSLTQANGFSHYWQASGYIW